MGAVRAEGARNEQRGEYRVRLDVYDGPLDLLLYLIRRDELDIHDIPIARITDSYLQYVHSLKADALLDINTAGEFLVMAATLMEIKSATLLPKPPADSPESGGTGPTGAAADLTDPRADLVRQLLEYKRFKDTARLLEQRQAKHALRFARAPAGLPDADEPPPLDLEEVQIWDLLGAFTKLMQEVGAGGRNRSGQHEVLDDDTPLDLHAADIEDRLKRERRVSLRDLIVHRKSRAEMIGVFLAILELVRQRRIALAPPRGPEVLRDGQDTSQPRDAEGDGAESAGDPAAIEIMLAPPATEPAPTATDAPPAEGDGTGPANL